MALLPFDSLPDDSRVWVFTAEQPFSEMNYRSLLPLLETFLEDWTSHRRDLNAGYSIRHARFIVIGIDESVTTPSGCSIDALFNALRTIGTAIGNPLVDTPDITWREGTDVMGADRNAFERRVSDGEIGLDTIVFDKTVSSVGELRNGGWEKPARASWHARAFTFVR